jgi:double-stranded uracil-DNA glycosylase
LPADAFDLPAFIAKIEQFQPQWVAFTSKNAAQSYFGKLVGYGVQPDRLDHTRLFVLPSPSGLATRFFDIEVWRALAKEIARR